MAGGPTHEGDPRSAPGAPTDPYRGGVRPHSAGPARDAGVAWQQEEPNQLWLRVNGQPHRLYTRGGGPYLGELAGGSTRIPSGHPEAFLEAFANIYTAAFNDMVARAAGKSFDAVKSLYPNVADGVDGMNFITQCVASSADGGAWRPLKHPLCRS